MAITQIKGNQIQDGTITGSDIDDSLEKDFTKTRTTTDDSEPGFLYSKISAGENIVISVSGISGSNQTLVIAATGSFGAQGSIGAQGSNGAQGAAGPQGPAGMQGSQGSTGLQGIVGLSGDNFFSSTTAGSIFSTGSLAIRGAESNVDSSYDEGSDVFFFVSGTIGITDNTAKLSVFGGDVIASGSLSIGGDGTVTGNFVVVNDIAVMGNLNVVSDTSIEGKLFVSEGADLTGSVKFNSGLSGSLTNLVDGTSYLIAGPGASIATGSNGSVTINGKFLGSAYVESGALGGEYGSVITTTCPIDDTIPQLSEGQVILTTPSYTTKSSTSKLKITAHIIASCAAGYTYIVHTHRDSATNAEAVTRIAPSGNHYPTEANISYYVDSPGSGTSIVYKTVVGSQSSGQPISVNGSAGTRHFGGKYLSTLSVEEFEQ